MTLKLDRLEIEDAGPDPRRLAAAIHRQLGERSGAVPVRDIAIALDIDEIRDESLSTFEGALVTDAERDRGSILVNRNSNSQRRRFTVGHELLHFLNPLHQQTADTGFECHKSDLALGGTVGTRSLSWHQRQEVEANRFSIELLAPLRLMKPYLKGDPDLEHVLPCATTLQISKEAAARRYVELHGAQLAIVFTKNDVVVYSDRAEGFPPLLKRDDPIRGRSAAVGMVSSMDEDDSTNWLKYPRGERLFSQTFGQADGHAMTMLVIEGDEGVAPGLEDTYDRLAGH